MKKRILYSMILLSTVGLILVSAALFFVFYSTYSQTVKESLRNRAETFIDNDSPTTIEVLAITKSSDMRVTVVSPAGDVIFDNVAAGLPNHGDREEICDALATGFGESRRFSDTLSEETNYYAVRLTDDYVLRVAMTTRSIVGHFLVMLPVVNVLVILMAAAAFIMAGRLTKKIVEPLNNVDMKGELAVPYDELAPFVRTIAEQRRQIESQLSDLESHADTLHAIMDNMNEGLTLVDGKGLVISANKSILRILGREAASEHMNILELFRDVTFSAHLQAALAGSQEEMNMEIADRIYRVYFSPVKGGGAIILYMDTTESSRAEKLRREFSANVSHELKTPLTSIYGSAELLVCDMVKEEDRAAFYRKIKDEASRLISLIDDIMLLSRLDESGAADDWQEADLTAIAWRAAAALAPKASEGGVTVQVSSEPVMMRANPALIYDLFFNLIDNAIKYNLPQGNVQVELLENINAIHILVRDTGIGIPPNAQHRVFERFYRVDASRSRHTGGTGLGLAIARHIVMAHGGTIKAKSEGKGGTTIHVLFSRQRGQRGENAQAQIASG